MVWSYSKILTKDESNYFHLMASDRVWGRELQKVSIPLLFSSVFTTLIAHNDIVCLHLTVTVWPWIKLWLADSVFYRNTHAKTQWMLCNFSRILSKIVWFTFRRWAQSKDGEDVLGMGWVSHGDSEGPGSRGRCWSGWKSCLTAVETLSGGQRSCLLVWPPTSDSSDRRPRVEGLNKQKQSISDCCCCCCRAEVWRMHLSLSFLWSLYVSELLHHLIFFNLVNLFFFLSG